MILDDPAVGQLFTVLPAARLVGGCVRDQLAGEASADIDLATPDHPDAIVAALEHAGLRAIPTGIAHGTVTAMVGGRAFEVTTLRRDVTTDGRHAEVAWTADWRLDASRRDFTINAMSMTPDGTVHDYFGGRADLAARRVRFVGDAAARVAEDYLRILRYFRFQARYGDTPDPDALAAIGGGLPGLATLSAERVWSELKRILLARDPGPSLRLMQRTGVLGAVIPEGADPARGGPLPPDLLPPDPLLRLAGMLTGDAAAFARRLKLSAQEAERLSALRGPPAHGSDADLRRAMADTPTDVLVGRSWLAGQPDAMRARLRAIPRPHFPLEGRDVVALGVPAGPAVGALLRRVRAWWWDGGCVADATECRAALARELAHRLAGDAPG